MDDKSFERQLNALIVEIGSLSQEELDKLDVQKSLSVTQETLDFLRLSIKYMVFDLEATRRENAYLRKLLDEERD